MTIYVIQTTASEGRHWICPDQATIDQGQAMGWSGIFSIGSLTEVNNILKAEQENWLAANIDSFSVNKDIDVTEGIQWIPVDLDTEPDNTDMYYQVFDVVNGHYNEAIGLANAKQLLEQTKNNCYEHFGLTAYSTYDTFPAVPKQLLKGA